MSSLPSLHAIGIMTGNSLDGIDLVLSRFGPDHVIEDICSSGGDLPESLFGRLQRIRTTIRQFEGNMEQSLLHYDREHGKSAFRTLIRDYTDFVADHVLGLIELAIRKGILKELTEVDLIGFHGQTCAHFPPSIAAKNAGSPYTIQIGNGQRLADRTGIPVVYDFRSDDIFNGGEGAPLAPLHHEHLAKTARDKGFFPLAFCNAGNTGNISVISRRKHESHEIRNLEMEHTTLGWDTGPFNHYPDELVRKERSEACDFEGKYGSRGKVNRELLKCLFEQAAKTQQGENFLLRTPPKSSDPQWYREIRDFPELSGAKPIDGEVLSFEDRLRTAEYFSAYLFVHTLTLLPAEIEIPRFFALCGGGWKNPLSRGDFQRLLELVSNKNLPWNSPETPVLEEHLQSFRELREKFRGRKVQAAPSEEFGFNATVMEARIMSDAAVCRIRGLPFTTPQSTGTRRASLCGILRFPMEEGGNASSKLRIWMERFETIANSSGYWSPQCDPDWSRAAAGWKRRIPRPDSEEEIQI